MVAAFGLDADPAREPTVHGPDRVWCARICHESEETRWDTDNASQGLGRAESDPPDAAGLDIGSEEIWAAVAPAAAPAAVCKFGTFTPDLEALAVWLATCGVDTVAMESTGVYWIPVYEMLEAHGFQVYVVNTRHLKNVPGRKSDIQDCQWIQGLHSVGLLRGSFRPEAEIVALRAYLRHRTALIEYRAAHIQHMQKALQQMNVQLTQVLTDITGVTGLAIIRAIVAGERDPSSWRPCGSRPVSRMRRRSPRP